MTEQPGRSARTSRARTTSRSAATASRIDHWLLIEYRGLWARDALPGSGLSDQVKQHLRDQVASRPTAGSSSSGAPTAGGHARSCVAYAVSSRPG